MSGDHDDIQNLYQPFHQHHHHQSPAGDGSSSNFNLHLHPQGGSPIGLTLRKSNSLINLVEMTLSNEREQKKVDKLKASNFPALLLQIASWKRISKNEGDLVAKLYYAKKKLVWEYLEGPLKNKIEIQWSEISAIRAFLYDGQCGRLEIELNQPPQFGREINPQPRKHTQWKQTTDFTGGQASICRRHSVIFPPGVLDKQYEKLLQCDDRLFNLSQQHFPFNNYPFFYHSLNPCLDYSKTNVRPQPHLMHFHEDANANSQMSVMTFPYWNEEGSKRDMKKNQERGNNEFPEIPFGVQDHLLPFNDQKSWIHIPQSQMKTLNQETDSRGFENIGISQLSVHSGIGIQEAYGLPWEQGMEDLGSLYRNQYYYPDWT